MTAPISLPKVTLNIIPAAQTVGLTEEKVLFIGQMKTGSATAGALVENIGVSGEENALFGQNSLLAGMIRAARKLNQTTRFDAIPLADNGSGVAATGTLAITGPATAAGSFVVTVGSGTNYQYTIAVANADTATTIGAALAAAINADANVPVTAASVTGTVTFTVDNKGTVGNGIGLQVTGSVTGVGFTLTGMASGATDPVLTSVFDPIADARYQIIVWPNSYSKSTVVNFLDGRFNATNAVLDGVAITSNTDTFANLLTAVTALNSKSLVYFCNKKVANTLYKGSALFELDDEIASQFAALSALRLTDGADLSRIVTGAQGALDTFGGISLASLPYFNTPFFNLPLIQTGVGFLSTEVTQLNAQGSSVIGNNSANNTVICGEVYTTYKTDSAGNPDTSFEFLNYVNTISVAREYMFNNLRARFAQTRLTSGDLLPNRVMVNADGIKSFLDSLYAALAALAVLQAGEAALTFFKLNRTVTLDLSAGKATVQMLAPIVTQLRQIVATIQMSFQNFGG